MMTIARFFYLFCFMLVFYISHGYAQFYKAEPVPEVNLLTDPNSCLPCQDKVRGEFDDCFADHVDDLPITTDTRIRTNIYNPNEVYLVILHYGFQSNIEFSSGEEAETISLGDTYGWQITSVGKRLIIRPLEKNIKTNMTVITNKRTYQFDLVSKEASRGYEKELVYVTKFYYPKKRSNFYER